MAKISKKSKRRLFFFAPICIFAIVYFFVIFIGYIMNFVSLKLEENDLKSNLINLQTEKANLKIEVTKLNDPDYVARYAKENYLYSSDGEYVLKIDNNKIAIKVNKKNISTLTYVGIGSLLILTVLILKKKKKPKKVS